MLLSCPLRLSLDHLRPHILRLTSGSGLSLVENCMLLAQQDGTDVSALFGVSTTYVSAATFGATLADLNGICERTVKRSSPVPPTGTSRSGTSPTFFPRADY